MDVLRISKRFRENYAGSGRVCSDANEIRELIDIYRSIPLTLPIADVSVRRVCEVLTKEGYDTLESCEGHGKNPPKVFFDCPDDNRLRHLTDILYQESEEKNFEWVIDRESFDDEYFGTSNTYIIRPKIKSGKRIDHKTYSGLIDDLDIIGLCVLRYFGYADVSRALADAK